MLRTMGITVCLGAHGDAREAVITAGAMHTARTARTSARIAADAAKLV